jgi:hypothetical protein
MMELTTVDLVILISTILLMCWGTVVVFLHFRRTIREKRKEATYKHCKNCGARLSEWFRTGSGYMRCFSCDTVSEYKCHQEVKK